MIEMASQITSFTVVYSTVYSDADQTKHQSSASLAFVRGIHRDRWIPRTKGQLRGKCFHLMTSSLSQGHTKYLLEVIHTKKSQGHSDDEYCRRGVLYTNTPRHWQNPLPTSDVRMRRTTQWASWIIIDEMDTTLFLIKNVSLLAVYISAYHICIKYLHDLSRDGGGGGGGGGGGSAYGPQNCHVKYNSFKQFDSPLKSISSSVFCVKF